LPYRVQNLFSNLCGKLKGVGTISINAYAFLIGKIFCVKLALKFLKFTALGVFFCVIFAPDHLLYYRNTEKEKVADFVNGGVH
jgi:hypothetical protein